MCSMQGAEYVVSLKKNRGLPTKERGRDAGLPKRAPHQPLLCLAPD